MTTKPQNPEVEEETWEQKIERHMAEKGYTDLDDPEQKRKFGEYKPKFNGYKANDEAHAKAKTNYNKAKQNLETGSAPLALTYNQVRAVRRTRADVINQNFDLPAGETKPTIRKIRTVQESEKPKAEILDKPKTPYKPLKSVKATNAPKDLPKAPERKIMAQPEPVIAKGLSAKEKQGLLLERAWLKFKLGGMDLDALVAEINSIKKATLSEAYSQFEVIAKANATTVAQIVKAGKQHG